MFKKIILNLNFVKKDREEVYRKAFKHASDDLKETNQEDIEKIAKELMEQRLQDMLTGVDLNGVITIDRKNGFILIGGEKADTNRLLNLKSEAEMLKQMELWKILQETPRELAHRTLFIHSESMDDLKKGKSMLYLLSQQENIIDILRNTKI